MGDVVRINLLKAQKGDDLRDRGSLLTGDQAASSSLSESSPSEIHESIHPILIVDMCGHIHDANAAALFLLDQKIDVLKTMAVSDVILRLDHGVFELICKAAQVGRTVVMHALCARRDGSWIPREVVVNDVEVKEGQQDLIYLVLNEVCRQPGHAEPTAGIESMIPRNDRLEMAGAVVGQIAHDFNNLLTPLLAYPDLIRNEIGGNPKAVEYLDIIEKTAGDMARLTRTLLTLARRRKIGTEAISVNEVIGQVIEEMQPLVPAGISIKLELEDNLLDVTGSRDQVKRVIENLCQNAIEAMGTTGVLQMKTENIYLDTLVGNYSAVTIGEYVKITVSDTGCGISKDIRDKIFDPFFTTKKASKQRGSGLGLTFVHGIIRDHRGYIVLESHVGQGTIFSVYLPISRNAVQVDEQSGMPHGTERILVVDDDPQQVQVLTNLLEVLGYAVTGVNSGEQCLRLLRLEGRHFDLIILDMVMDHGLDGLTTYLEVSKTVPDQRVILVSGYDKAARRTVKAQQMGAGTYLRKPISLERLARSVREELDRKPVVLNRGTLAKVSRILIADDEPMIRRLFGMIILSEFPDAVIEQASHGAEAVAAFQAERYDLIIMDIQMPVMDGRDAFLGIERLCAERGWTMPSVIFCTGFTPSEFLAQIIHNRSQHCLLRKPVNAEALLEAVRQKLKA